MPAEEPTADLPPGLQLEVESPVRTEGPPLINLPLPGQLVVLRTRELSRAIRIDPDGNPVGSPFQLPAGFALTETIHSALICRWAGSWVFQVQTDGSPSRWVQPYSGPTTVPVWEEVPDDALPARQS